MTYLGLGIDEISLSSHFNWGDLPASLGVWMKESLQSIKSYGEIGAGMILHLKE